MYWGAIGPDNSSIQLLCWLLRRGILTGWIVSAWPPRAELLRLLIGL